MAKDNDSASYAGPSGGSKRKSKDNDDDSAPNSSKKQRTRVSFSCGECHRRKQRCDRNIPCQHCIARKVPELCKAYMPGKSDQDVSVRLARLEHIIEMALPQYIPPGAPGGIPGRFMQDDETHSLPDEQDPRNGTFQSGRWFGHSASGSIAPGTVLEQLEHVVMPPGVPGINMKAPGSGMHPYELTLPPPNDSIIDAVQNGLEPTAADNLKTLVQECGVSPHKVAELLSELPPNRTSAALVDYYFQSINWTRYPISEQDFRASYDSICEHGTTGVGSPGDVSFLPLLFAVLAISVRLAPESIGGDARARRVTSLRYYWSSRRSLLIAAVIQPDSLDIVLTRLLSARFLTFDRRITECYSQLGAAVKTAQALGLHRDGASMNMEPGLVEYRRRIWQVQLNYGLSYLYHADRSYALVLGRPNSIQDEYTSTIAPSNIDDDPSSAPAPLPLSSPTRMTYVILRHQLATIIGRMVHHFQQVRVTSHYSEVLAIDDDLLHFINILPPHFSLEPDRTLDETMPFLPVHRYLLVTEVLFVRNSLHMPYILRKVKTDRYARSRNACFESAIKDFDVRRAFQKTVPKETQESLSNAYREFQTTLIAGIYLVLDPVGMLSEKMHEILDHFVASHEGARDLPETTRRELKTIEFLKNKASQMKNQAGGPRRIPIDPVLSGDNTEHPAHLLLGLQHSSPATPPTRSPYPSGRGPQSPTFQRLQQQHTGSQEDFPMSPTTTDSPDESAAQHLLDHWVTTLSNGPPVDGSNASIAASWNAPDAAGWVGTAPMVNSSNRPVPGLSEESDWNANYWEAIVNQIQQWTFSVKTPYVMRVTDVMGNKRKQVTAPTANRALSSATMQSINRFLYGPTPEEKVRAWQLKLRSEARHLDREMRQLDAATKQARTQVKQHAARGDVKSARILAREVVRSDKQKDKLSVSKARLGSIGNQLTQQMAMIKVTGSLQKSTEIMKLSNSLIKLPQISQTMREMSMEMTKAGIMEEMLEDTLDMEEDEEVEEEADAEVDKVLAELTDGKLGLAGSAGTELPSTQDKLEEEEAERTMEKYRQQLNGLLSG
ncbi:Snf7-domain-containing protein [Favolaschia claudopus]|uniref:Snf7-domain-containing protein n=1 Tax=Favolaschia claudopus TaxID=2862362 RepID=A0AAW0EDM7_9AGAR